MLQETSYKVDKKLIKKIAEFETSGKLSLNEPTGDFFYDSWKIKSEYQGTVFETALNALPFSIGEARLITLESGTCYFSHSDIDDRYHLNITGDCAALINLETKESWFLTNDGIWYEMDASPLHSAASFGQHSRKQIVVRKLLTKNNLLTPVTVYLTAIGENPRFVFDNSISSWLNLANKRGIISNFKSNGLGVCFDIDKEYVNEFEKIIPEKFEYEYR